MLSSPHEHSQFINSEIFLLKHLLTVTYWPVQVEGVLTGFDPFMNLVLDNAVEITKQVNKKSQHF
jgi:small nuclear ribonucleoprotein (snRNP)-like protein